MNTLTRQQLLVSSHRDQSSQGHKYINEWKEIKLLLGKNLKVRYIIGTDGVHIISVHTHDYGIQMIEQFCPSHYKMIVQV